LINNQFIIVLVA